MNNKPWLCLCLLTVFFLSGCGQQSASIIETKNINEGDIQIIGLTIDETKTRAGELFYSKLFSFMQLNSINFKFMIRILELPSINRNTQIQVYAQDTNLLTFNTMPDEDYLESLVKETIEALFAYQKQKEILDKNFNY
jgi:hypothetical protein